MAMLDLALRQQSTEFLSSTVLYCRYVCCNGDCPCSGRLGESKWVPLTRDWSHRTSIYCLPDLLTLAAAAPEQLSSISHM